jgi:hypothetical protein
MLTIKTWPAALVALVALALLVRVVFFGMMFLLNEGLAAKGMSE